jgi:4-amino-4-deoxy-L-arabinose transferase-like glycosyltransferase
MDFQKLARVVAILFLIFAFGFRAYSLIYSSIGFDEAGLAYVAQGISGGGQLYIDYFDHKPPLIHYLTAAAFNFVQPTTFSIKLLALIFDIALILSVFLVAKKLSNATYGLFAAVLMSAYNFKLVPNTETLMVLFGVWAFYFYIKSQEKRKPANFYLFVTGICIAIAIWFKQPAIFFYFSILIHIIYLRYKKQINTNGLFKEILMLTLGVLIISLPLLSYFLIKIGPSLLYSLIQFNLIFKGSSPRIFQLAKGLSILIFYLGYLLVVILSNLNIKSNKKEVLSTLIIFNIANLIFLLISPEIFYQHFFQLAPFTILLAIYCAFSSNQKFNKMILITMLFGLILLSLSSLEDTARDISSGNAAQLKAFMSYLASNVPKNSTFFSDNPVYTFLGGYKLNQPLVGAAPSLNSVFNYKFICTEDYLVLTHRQKYFSPQVQTCIKNNFILMKRFDNVGESFAEVYKSKK